ncbi:MAG: hypothetical protein ABI833_15760 [Acidobacteriota bacterium]
MRSLPGAALQFGKIGDENLQAAFAASGCVVHPSILNLSLRSREGPVLLGCGRVAALTLFETAAMRPAFARTKTTPRPNTAVRFRAMAAHRRN